MREVEKRRARGAATVPYGSARGSSGMARGESVSDLWWGNFALDWGDFRKKREVGVHRKGLRDCEFGIRLGCGALDSRVIKYFDV